MSDLANLKEIDSSVQSLSLIVNKKHLVIQSLCMKDRSRHYAVTTSSNSTSLLS